MDSVTFHEQAMRKPTRAPRVTSAQLAGMSDQEHADHLAAVIAWCAGRYIDSSGGQDIRAGLSVGTTYNEATLPGSKTMLAVSGPNGAGKSTLVRHWAAEFYRQQVRPFPRDGQLHRWEPAPGVRADVVPVVWGNLQANAKIAEVDAQILTFLRVGLSGTVRDMTIRAVRAMTRHRVRALVIDDVHLLNLRKGTGRDVLDHLKHLNTELGENGGSLVLVGANLDHTDLPFDPQIAARLRMFRLEPQPMSTAENSHAWKETVREIETQVLPLLPAAEPGVLEKHAALLHQRSEGYLGELIALVKHAVILAASQRQGALTEDLLASAPGSRNENASVGGV